MKLTYVSTKNGLTIKDILTNKLNISHKLLVKLKQLEGDYIFINSDAIKGINDIVNINDIVTVLFDYTEDNSNIFPTNMNLNIIYEDECYIIVNKPVGIPVHPSQLHYEDSLSNGIRYYFDSIGLKKKIRPVNRIDKDTSGIVIFAKNEYVQEVLIRQMASKEFVKEYIAVVQGVFDSNSKKRNYKCSYCKEKW